MNAAYKQVALSPEKANETGTPIAVIGNANLDIVGGMLSGWPDKGTEAFLDLSDMRIGGSAANTALVLDRLGMESGLISAVGSDLSGTMIETRFAGPLDRIIRIDGPSSVTFGLLHPGSERTFFSTRGHLDHFGETQAMQALEEWPLNGALVLVSGSFAMPELLHPTASMLSFLKDQGAQTAIDPGWPGEGWTPHNIALMREWVSVSDHILINDKELLGLTEAGDLGEATRKLSGMLQGSAVGVVKCGAKGALCILRTGRCEQIAAPAAEVLDTIGAGDAFNAGYLAAIARGWSAVAATRAGCRVATAVVTDFPRQEGPLVLDEEDPSR
ncbi:hypothetical protein B0E33_18730 [Roseibium algicola]|uniref:Carbohydrate kinase PfkB domain-containing protein n=1 Tax=Roseibium algicola TaxID=2857014 RepID=A0ABN4X166_9HYPH|nr:carbohydrate kinase family protein [Roseibium aggregatum]AQQ05362.1 hypothetical protein B0E33_18730 [Roseibium aggregatum]